MKVKQCRYKKHCHDYDPDTCTDTIDCGLKDNFKIKAREKQNDSLRSR